MTWRFPDNRQPQRSFWAGQPAPISQHVRHSSSHGSLKDNSSLLTTGLTDKMSMNQPQPPGSMPLRYQSPLEPYSPGFYQPPDLLVDDFSKDADATHVSSTLPRLENLPACGESDLQQTCSQAHSGGEEIIGELSFDFAFDASLGNAPTPSLNVPSHGNRLSIPGAVTSEDLSRTDSQRSYASLEETQSIAYSAGDELLPMPPFNVAFTPGTSYSQETRSPQVASPLPDTPYSMNNQSFSQWDPSSEAAATSGLGIQASGAFNSQSSCSTAPIAIPRSDPSQYGNTLSVRSAATSPAGMSPSGVGLGISAGSSFMGQWGHQSIPEFGQMSYPPPQGQDLRASDSNLLTGRGSMPAQWNQSGQYPSGTMTTGIPQLDTSSANLGGDFDLFDQTSPLPPFDSSLSPQVLISPVDAPYSSAQSLLGIGPGGGGGGGGNRGSRSGSGSGSNIPARRLRSASDVTKLKSSPSGVGSSGKAFGASSMPHRVTKTANRGKRQGPLTTEKREDAKKTRNEKTICIRCKAKRHGCHRDDDTPGAPCSNCLEHAGTRRWPCPCTNAYFEAQVKEGSLDTDAQQSVHYSTGDGMQSLSVPIPPDFDIDVLLRELGGIRNLKYIQVYQGRTQLYTLDLEGCFTYLTAVSSFLSEKGDRQATFSDFVDVDLLRLDAKDDEWTDMISTCVFKGNELSFLCRLEQASPDHVTSFVLTSSPQGAPVDFAGTSRVLDADSPADRGILLVAAQLARIVARKIEVAGYLKLQHELLHILTKSAKKCKDIIVALIKRLGFLIVALRRRLCAWKTRREDQQFSNLLSGCYPLAEEEDYYFPFAACERRVEELCQCLYVYFCCLKRSLKGSLTAEEEGSLEGVRMPAPSSSSTTTTGGGMPGQQRQFVMERLPKIGTDDEYMDGFAQWVDEGREGAGLTTGIQGVNWW